MLVQVQVTVHGGATLFRLQDWMLVTEVV